MYMAAEISPKGSSLDSSGNMDSEAPDCCNRTMYQQSRNAYKVWKRYAMNLNGKHTGPRRKTEVEWAKGIIADFQVSFFALKYHMFSNRI